jgi:hypothetical protein
MLFINRLVLIGLLSVGIAAATTAQAGVQLFTAEWYSESFGNECQGTSTSGGYMKTPGGGPALKCTRITPNFSKYSVSAMPLGIQCNANAPRCPISSTPTTGMGKFHPLGGNGNPTMSSSINCGPLSLYGTGTTVRPAKGSTSTGGTMTFRIPPLYRNPQFFTSGGQPDTQTCTATSTGVFSSYQTRFGADRGLVQQGKPVAGSCSLRRRAWRRAGSISAQPL